MPTYTESSEAKSIVDGIIDDSYPELNEAKVTIACLLAHASRKENGEPTGPAVKLHGYPCDATIKVNSYRDRVEGKTDCTIVIDGDTWHEWPGRKKRAVLHHEIEHIELQYDEEGGLKTDDIGRPKIKLKLHDWQVEGFAKIAKIYGDDSNELKQIHALKTEHGQLLMPWG